MVCMIKIDILAPINEHEITGSSGFRFLSSPVSGKVYADLLEELWTQGAEGSDLPESSPIFGPTTMDGTL